MAMNVVVHGESTTDVITQADGNTRPALERLKLVGGAAQAADQTVHAGDENPSSTTLSFKRSMPVCNLAIIGKTTAVTIGGGVANDTHLIGLHISTALNGTCVITGFADSDGTAASITLPIGSVGFKDFQGALNSAGALTVTCGTAGDDNYVAVLYWPAG